jgi:hypothetical protein
MTDAPTKRHDFSTRFGVPALADPPVASGLNLRQPVATCRSAIPVKNRKTTHFSGDSLAESDLFRVKTPGGAAIRVRRKGRARPANISQLRCEISKN